MKLIDERIINYLKKKNGVNFDFESYLNPTIDKLRDSKKFNKIDEITARITAAIFDRKKILIYGDYDSDGVCATTILYLFLKSKGADVSIFIPNRFENGYGISVEAIEEIIDDYSPDLIITVDLGITAIEEIEILNQEGIEVIITDHHLPLSEVPNCLILDPKYKNEEYGFDSLCGAAVAMKLVEALSSREEANKYLDFAAIATVGDIVPLIDENRVIAKCGIDKINAGDCHKSLTFIKKKLEIDKLNSTDISFKIVPRFNACGRMNNAVKVFEFLIEENEKLLEQKYSEIEADNNLRLACIDKGIKEIDKQLNTFSYSDPAIFVVGNFNEGIIGILASRICNEYNRPTIVFSKTESGTYKGSGRSIEGVDLHKIIARYNDMLENFGGHTMAVGLEIEPSVFEVFKSKVNSAIREEFDNNKFLINNRNYDIEISEDDITDYFYNQLSLLEPFGCDNEKPVLAMKQEELIVQPISEKAFKHYKSFTKKNHSFIGFNFYDYLDILKSTSEKYIKLDLSINSYNGRSMISATAKDLFLTKLKLENNDNMIMGSLYNLYYSIFDFNNKENYFVEENLEKIILEKFAEDNYGTVVVVSTKEDIELINKLNLTEFFAAKAFKSNQNAVVFAPKGIYSLAAVKGYKNIIFLSKYFDNEHLYFTQNLKVYEPAKKLDIDNKFEKDRTVFAKIYTLIKSNSQLKANNEIDLACKLTIREGTLSAAQILFAMIVFMELNFIEWDSILNQMKVLTAKKVELDKSKFYNEVK